MGFRPLRFEERRHPQTGKFLGIRFTEQVLLEVSAAPVPANENAVRRSGDGTASHVVDMRLASLERQVAGLRGGHTPSAPWAALPQGPKSWKSSGKPAPGPNHNHATLWHS